MILPIQGIALGAIALASIPYINALSAADIPSDTPVSQLITSATAALAQGQAQDALTYFNVAVDRDPRNYLTIFRRGAAYLQLGKSAQANQDFDRVLAIKPTFEGALIQRAKIRSRNGNWAEASSDYKAAGKGNSEEMKELQEAQGAETLSAEAENAGDWGGCTSHADVAIAVAGSALGLRQRRARCRFEKGEIVEGISDLLHVAQMSSSTDAHLQISATSFFALNESDNGMSQLRKCLHSDPDSKACSKLLKREKKLNKERQKVEEYVSKRQFNQAVKLLEPSKEDPGFLKEIQQEYEEHRQQGTIPKNAPSNLYNGLVELTCEALTEMNSLKRAQTYCDQALLHNPNCLPALIGKATRELDSDDFEGAIRTLNQAREHHQNSQKANELLQKAQTLLKRSKQKDYYKVLGVPRDADEREVKRAYRKLTKEFHPDKVAQQGVPPEEAQRKMATINEAYEVLSDPELKERFDRGDDPNDTSQQGQNPFQGSPFGFGGNGQPVFFQQRSGGGGGGGGGQQFKFQFPGGGGGGFPF